MKISHLNLIIFIINVNPDTSPSKMINFSSIVQKNMDLVKKLYYKEILIQMMRNNILSIIPT